MKAVIQRVTKASVKAEGKNVGEIGTGLLLFLGVGKNDTDEDLELLVYKVPKFRIFQDDDGKMNLSVVDAGGSILVVSQFTLYGSWRKGNRPGFSDAAPPEKGQEYYEKFISAMRNQGIHTESGMFGSTMEVELVNDGPVTFVLDTKE